MTTPAPRVVTYALGGDDDACSLFVFGDASASTIALLCAGYPDDHGSFLPLARRLAKECDVLVGVACLPGYDDRPDDGRPWRDHKRDGYTFNECAASIREAAKALRAESVRGRASEERAKFIGIFHDWGASFGQVFANRALEEGEGSADIVPDRLVFFDVLCPPRRRTRGVPAAPPRSLLEVAYAGITQWTYRILIALAFLLRRYVSEILALPLFSVGFKLLELLRISPLREIDDKFWSKRTPPVETARLVYMGYLYWQIFRVVFTGRIKSDFHGMHMSDLDKIPTLFMYGMDKNVMFHEEQWVLYLKQAEEKGGRSRAVAVDGAGHWLYLQQPDVCFEEIKKFAEL